jgi:hypothetical protein
MPKYEARCPDCNAPVLRSQFGPTPRCAPCAVERRRKVKKKWWDKNPGLSTEYARYRKERLNAIRHAD